jgi:hypothetical protein
LALLGLAVSALVALVAWSRLWRMFAAH